MTTAAASMERADAARERRWRRVQAASGLAFGLFTAVHLVNQWLAPLGPEAYDGFQAAARAVYQQPAVEIGLVALPLLVHVVAALRRMRIGRRRGGWRMRLHRVTGFLLLAVIFGHVVATRGPSLAKGFHPGFAGISFSLWWLPGVFFVYYLLFGAAALYHGINGTLLALHALGLRREASPPGGRAGLVLPVAAGTALLLLALLAFGGRLFPIDDPTRNPYARMWERYGVSLE
jgi:succinate dehydrogenase/fumarate reductase cytochrome b subunit